MALDKINPKDLTPNPNNPRTITESKFKELVESVRGFPEMLELRPFVIDENNVVLGGNMRLRAVLKLKMKAVPFIRSSDLSPEKVREFIIKDNTHPGEWDWDQLANEWEKEDLIDWGVEAPQAFGPEFSPTSEPQFSGQTVTEEDIQRQARELALKMVGDMTYRDVICPECGHEYKVKE